MSKIPPVAHPTAEVRPQVKSKKEKVMAGGQEAEFRMKNSGEAIYKLLFGSYCDLWRVAIK